VGKFKIKGIDIFYGQSSMGGTGGTYFIIGVLFGNGNGIFVVQPCSHEEHGSKRQ
jgi:hypothetical protein